MALILLLSISGCNGEVTNADLKLWTNNPEGLKRIGVLLQDPEAPLELRVQSLVVLGEVGKGFQIRGVLQDATDRDTVVQALVPLLNERLAAEGEGAVFAKIALLAVMDFCDESTADGIRKDIAQWALDGLNVDSPTEKIKRQVEHRIRTGELVRLGQHASTGAALLLARGFEVRQLHDFLLGLDSDEARRLLLDALKAYEKLPEVEVTATHLTRIAQVGDVDAALHLFALYDQLKGDAADTAADAHGLALDLIAQERALLGKDRLVERVIAELKTDNPDDRHYAAMWLLKNYSMTHLKTVLEAFADDGTYAAGSIDPQKSVIDFCKTGLSSVGPEAHAVVREQLASQNRIAQAMALVCVKVLGVKGVQKHLKKLNKSRKSLEDFLGRGITLGSLARNVDSGMALIADVDRRHAAGDLDATAHASQRFYALVILDKVGDDLKTEVAARATEAPIPPDPEEETKAEPQEGDAAGAAP
jgi:hypothetical protein